jgi:hypothetical protein
MIKKILGLLVLISLIAAVIFWFNREQWLADFNQERQQKAQEFKEKGLLFAQDANQQQCIEEGLEQLKQCFAFDCTLDQGVFLKSCLSQAKPSAQFCEEVPEYHEKLTEDDKYWLKDQCWDEKLNSDSCKFLYKQKIHFCSQ